MKTCILQISYLPDYSFFYLMKQCHLVILLDDLKQPKTNIASIKGKDLEIPVESWGYFNEVKINKKSSWKEDHLKDLRMEYGKEPHFKEIYEVIEKRFNEKSNDVYQMNAPELLVDICVDLIYWIKLYLDLPCEFNFSSKLGFTGYPVEERCELMCQATGTTEYINYAVIKKPKPEGISIIDAMFKKGKGCLK